MGSSAKKKKEKKKDFQKAKLKVGKAKPKAANSTDTSFKAKGGLLFFSSKNVAGASRILRLVTDSAYTVTAIALKQQSLSTNAPTVEAQCAHQLSLLNHKSDTQRRDSLAYLTTVISTHPPGLPLPQPASIIVPAVQRLVLDGSKSVREQMLKLVQSLPKVDIASHTDSLLLHTRAGMTHLSTDIRTFALELLEWLLSVAGDEVVSCAGGWVKTLKCFLSLLGWQAQIGDKWSANKMIGFGNAAGNSKILVKQMSTLAAFLRAGLVQPTRTATLESGTNNFPLWQTEHHVLSERSNAFAHLNIFGAARDEEAEMYEDREDRQRVFHELAESAIAAGLEQATKGGGELGRAGAQLRKAMREGMADFHRADQS